MGKLDTAERKKLPKAAFGEPGKRAYPMPEKGHAIAAKARASEMEHRGRLSKAEETRIDKKADKVMDHKKHIDDRKEKPEHRGDLKTDGHRPHMGKAVAHLHKDHAKWENHKDRK